MAMFKIGSIYYPMSDLHTIEERSADTIVVRLRGHDPIVLSGEEAKAVLAQLTPETPSGLKKQSPAK